MDPHPVRIQTQVASYGWEASGVPGAGSPDSWSSPHGPSTRSSPRQLPIYPGHGIQNARRGGQPINCRVPTVMRSARRPICFRLVTGSSPETNHLLECVGMWVVTPAEPGGLSTTSGIFRSSRQLVGSIPAHHAFASVSGHEVVRPGLSLQAVHPGNHPLFHRPVAELTL